MSIDSEILALKMKRKREAENFEAKAAVVGTAVFALIAAWLLYSIHGTY